MQDQRRQSMLCPNCRKLISSNEPRCPYCGIANPGSWLKNNPLTRGFQNPEQFLRAIIYTNVGMFMLSLLLNPQLSSLSLNPLTLLSPDNRTLLLLGATGTLPIERFGRWWTLLSANYLHGGILHILFNMYALNQIGPLIVQEYGGYRMFIIYTLGGVFGYLVSYFAGVSFTIGASAAVCALIGAAIYYGKSRGGAYGQIIFRQVGGWALGIFAFGLLVPGINNWGHGGGLAGGILLGMILGYRERGPESLSHKLLAAGCLLGTAASLLWAVSSTVLYKFFF